MRLFWTHIWQSAAYRAASADERRLIEFRFSLARTLRVMRRRRKVTQKSLAEQIGVAQPTVSRAERASNRVSLDIAVRGLIALGCSDANIAAAFNVSMDPRVAQLRKAAARPMYGVARAAADPAVKREHRFLRRGSGKLRRML